MKEHRHKFLSKNELDSLIPQIYFWNKSVHVSESSSVHHQDFFTVHAANLYDIYHCCVYSEKTPDDGQTNCPKHVEFYSKKKFDKFVHLVGFIIRIALNVFSQNCGIKLAPMFRHFALLRSSGEKYELGT